ncbi:MAG: hypothetical protein JO320_12430 [Alphaproteobacteria bacterium]|nr:hypothetical protein [Alphaproteobacteria bacterium]
MTSRRLAGISPAAAVLVLFLALSWLYWHGYTEIYYTILRRWGIEPFRSPFVDASGWLAAWECTRQGVDVIPFDPCDVLQRGYASSPLWLALAGVPLGVADTTIVGWFLGLAFIASLTVLPTPRGSHALILVIAATMSTMVVFALERANADLLLFLLVLAAGLLAESRLMAARLLGYGIALFAALLKYYPIVVLVAAFRERIAVLTGVILSAACAVAAFWAIWHDDLARGLPTIAAGPYSTDLFAAKNLPFMIGMIVEETAAPSRYAGALGWALAAGLYTVLFVAALAICRRVLLMPGLAAAAAALSGRERTLVVIGSAVITGCFFAGQSIGYRGIFLLLVLPGLLALSRSPARGPRLLFLATAIVIVLLMWGEALRRAFDGGFGFWLLRELGWWWSVSVMLAIIADFLQQSPAWRGATEWLGRAPAAAALAVWEPLGQRRERGPRDGRGGRYC